MKTGSSSLCYYCRKASARSCRFIAANEVTASKIELGCLGAKYEMIKRLSVRKTWYPVFLIKECPNYLKDEGV